MSDEFDYYRRQSDSGLRELEQHWTVELARREHELGVAKRVIDQCRKELERRKASLFADAGTDVVLRITHRLGAVVPHKEYFVKTADGTWNHLQYGECLTDADVIGRIERYSTAELLLPSE